MVVRHAEVIGGGIGGLTAAAALARQGWRVRVHERQSEIRAVGAGIYVWDNGLSALAEIGAYAAATRGAHIGPAIEARSRHGRPLYRIDINGDGQPRCYTLLRNQLVAALAQAALAAGAELVTDSTAVDVTPDGQVDFTNGRCATADLIVVANGVHPPFRDRLGLTARRVRMREGAARLMVPSAPDHLPPTDSAKHLEHFQGRRRLLYTPCTPESLYLAVVADSDDAATRGDVVDIDSWVRSFPYLPRRRPDVFEVRPGNSEIRRRAQHRLKVEQRPGIERAQRTSYRMRLLNSVPDLARDPLLTLAGRLPGLTSSQLAATRLRPTTGDGADARSDPHSVRGAADRRRRTG
ncbi:FAD-dependent oxidoreductase [Nocardia rhizosphaerihabitans]|uniref:FAD-binding domain-containing protein n=1 Tax=Nocardia rhizosphaerihabitans TaxID=1691570 RepID=A0ABQ2KD82_9NOCA|nr:FAD-dependent monooxygenase [Nocardia rhizosphaerihabitans]GGN78930.1 hypothetical protein GCM10011610_27010 [Nocardia rhizosphaerihabitans]